LKKFVKDAISHLIGVKSGNLIGMKSDIARRGAEKINKYI
tara:strand:- start:334 stop:453 length:120 start_codon:yes stop_codon:yes gene_type:complete